MTTRTAAYEQGTQATPSNRSTQSNLPSQSRAWAFTGVAAAIVDRLADQTPAAIVRAREEGLGLD